MYLSDCYLPITWWEFITIGKYPDYCAPYCFFLIFLSNLLSGKFYKKLEDFSQSRSKDNTSWNIMDSASRCIEDLINFDYYGE